ncbi:hypothetical protein Tsubulata_047790 [Turnera subulata]|uniref:Uncharacterized protein n=1 Tax=Turnera subulata TaxID=218843 RepID=A0A9Q0G4Q9_9ROSI|nr:hypothetical protein Tsubulata_047790 [Turnera subulata]
MEKLSIKLAFLLIFLVASSCFANGIISSSSAIKPDHVLYKQCSTPDDGVCREICPSSCAEIYCDTEYDRCYCRNKNRISLQIDYPCSS